MKKIIVFDPSKVRTEDLINAIKCLGLEYGVVRARPGAIDPPIFILGKRPSLWERFLTWWFKNG